MNIGGKIKSHRESMGLSQNKLATLSGVAQSYIRNLENNEQNPTLGTLERICNVLGITVLQLLGDHPEDLSPDLVRLLEAAKKLTPKEREKLTDLIQTFLERHEQ